MSINRRTAAKAGLFSLMSSALVGLSSASAKDNKPGGFGATASVSVNSGNNSGNQTFQENQAILTMDANGNVQVAQGNAVGGAVQQGQVVSSPAIQPANGGDCGCGSEVPPECANAALKITVGDSDPALYIPYHCIRYYCGS